MTVGISGGGKRAEHAAEIWEEDPSVTVVPLEGGKAGCDFIDCYGDLSPGELSYLEGEGREIPLGLDGPLPEGGGKRGALFYHNDFVFLPLFLELFTLLSDRKFGRIHSSRFTFAVPEQHHFREIISLLSLLFGPRKGSAPPEISARGKKGENGRMEYCSITLIHPDPEERTAVEWSIASPSSGLERAAGRGAVFCSAGTLEAVFGGCQTLAEYEHGGGKDLRTFPDTDPQRGWVEDVKKSLAEGRESDILTQSIRKVGGLWYNSLLLGMEE